MADGGYVNTVNEWHAEEREETEESDARFNHSVNKKWMALRCGADARQREAAETESAHERGEQDCKGNGRRADDELQHLIPDNFVDERGAAAGREKNQQQREPARRGGGYGTARSVCGCR